MPADHDPTGTAPEPALGQPVGRTSNTRYFTQNARVLVAWPDEGALDTAATATENAEFQIEYFGSVGKPGVVVIYFDRLLGQDRGARKVYAQRPGTDVALGIVLVGGSLLSRALGAFFMGLQKPRVPIRLFATREDATSWIEELLKAHP